MSNISNDKKNSVPATLSASLYVTCPGCLSEIDLFSDDMDNDYIYTMAIFNNHWDYLEEECVECPKCGREFTISAVEY